MSGARRRARLGAARWDAAALAGLAVATGLVAVSSGTTLWDRDEPRFAQATVEMLRSGNFLYPTFNGQLRPDKPVLIYWLMSIPVRLFGPSEVALRSVAALAMAAAALLTYAVGRWLFSPRAALLALAMMVTTPLALVVGSAATTDAVLLAFISLAMAVFAHGFLRGWRWHHGPVLAIALGAGLLTKGPVGFVIPLTSMCVTWWLGRRDTPLTAKHLASVGAAAAAGLGLFLVWALPANHATAGEFARAGIGHHLWRRMFEPLEGHGGTLPLFLPYYLAVVLLAFFPWTLYLGGAARALVGSRLGGAKGRALLVGWIAPTLLGMSLVATKLPHYILPIWPALALAAAGTHQAAQNGELDERDRSWLRHGHLLLLPGALILGAGLIALPWILPAPGLRLPSSTAGVVVAATSVIAVQAHHAGRLRGGSTVLFLGFALWSLVLVGSVLPALDRMKVSPPIADVIRARTTPDVPVAVHGFGEPSLLFYLGRWPVREIPSDDDVVEWSRNAGLGVLVLPRPLLEGIERRHGRLGLVPMGDARGFNFGRGTWVELLALRRGADRP